MLLDGLFVIASFIGVLVFLVGMLLSAIKTANIVAAEQNHKQASSMGFPHVFPWTIDQ